MKKPDWAGVYPAVTTQFHADFALDIEGTARHVEALLAGGVQGLIFLGSVGENTALEYHEKLALLNEMMRVVRGRVPVLTGVAETTTMLASRYARDAEKIGADGLMVLPAMIYKADSREALAHFRSVAESTSLPVMIYNNPVSYGVDVTPEMFLRLADIGNVVAIKESSDNVRRLTDIVNTCGDRFILFSGVDDLVLESVMLGSQGWVSGLVNAFPNENRVLWELAKAGRFSDALPLYRWYTPLLHLDTKPKLVQYIKLCMAEVGLGSEITRPPRLPLEGAERDQILSIIRHALGTRPDLAVYSAAVS